MEITEVRIKLMEEPGERLKAFCSITFDDCFVVRDLKIIEGANGPFVAMPSRKLTAHCGNCRSKNHLRAGYCNQCGTRLKENQASRDEEGRAKLYADIAHPINTTCREMIQQRVIAAFEEEKVRSKLPGYVPSYDDFDQEEALAVELRADAPRRPRVRRSCPGSSRKRRASSRRSSRSSRKPRRSSRRSRRWKDPRDRTRPLRTCLSLRTDPSPATSGRESSNDPDLATDRTRIKGSTRRRRAVCLAVPSAVTLPVPRSSRIGGPALAHASLSHPTRR